MVGVLDGDVPARVRQPRRVTDDVLAEERRNRHRITERNDALVAQYHPVRFDGFDRDPDVGADPLLAQERAEQSFAARQAAHPEMPQERFGCDEGQRYAAGQPQLAQLLGGVEQEFVGGAETTGALGRGHHDRAWVVQELRPGQSRGFGVGQGRDRLGVPTGSDARHRVEVVAVARGQHEVVVGLHPAVHGHRPARRVDGGDLAMDEPDAVVREGALERERDVGGVALPERQPDERRVEDETVRRRDDGDHDLVAQLVLELEGSGQAGEVPADDDHMRRCHVGLLCIGDRF